jgi:hypothetical protein
MAYIIMCVCVCVCMYREFVFVFVFGGWMMREDEVNI